VVNILNLTLESEEILTWATEGEFVSPIIYNTNFISKSDSITDLTTCRERHETF
jgi:hypothetical protein